MKAREYLEFLWRSGHFWRPGSECNNITYDELDTLAKELDNHLVKDATQVFQQSDQNFDYFSLDEHFRATIPDGDIGPVTKLMSEMPRCAMPDWTPPEGVELGVNDPELAAAVDSMRKFATGSGSWPVPGCDPERTDIHSVRVNINTSGASSHQKSLLSEILKRVEACEAQMGQRVRHVLDGDASKAEHDVRFQNIPGGTIGFAYFPQPDTCNQTVQCRIDNTYNTDVVMLAGLFVHEYKGHSDGLQHTRGGIMNPSILRHERLSWIGDPHESTKRRYFGGEPIDVTPTPVPPPEPPSDHNGVFAYRPTTDWPAGESRVLKIKVEEM
jgi:hypothetical protein